MTQPPPPPPGPAPQPGAGDPKHGSSSDTNQGGLRKDETPQAAPQPAPQAAPQAAPAESTLHFSAPPQSPPPGQPSYGYPGQQGQQAQPATPAYGHQPDPYAQPQPQAQSPQPQPQAQPQPSYGYPQYGQPAQPAAAPTVPMASAGSAGRKINAQVAIIVAAVVAIALIIGGGVWYSSSKDDGGKDDVANSGGTTGGDDGGGDGKDSGPGPAKEKLPANPAAHVLFQVPAPAVKNDDIITVSGSWLTDKVYAKSGVAEVVGYDPAKGTKLWTLTLPGPVCEASRQASEDNKAAIVFQPVMPVNGHGSACTQLAAIDLDTGKALWTQTAKSGDQETRFDNVTISGGTVAAGSIYGGTAFDLASGKQLWKPKTGDTCIDRGYGGGPALVAVRRCGSSSDAKLSVQTIDPKTGKVLSEYDMVAGVEYASVVSTDPLVVAADITESAGDGSGISDLFSIDNRTGQLRAKISLPSDEYAASCDSISHVEDCHGIVAGRNDRVYVATEEQTGKDLSESNDVVAFDLATGKPTGQRLESEDGFVLTPLRMDGGNLLAYAQPPYDKGGRILSVDGDSFKPSTLLQNPSDEAVRDVESDMQPDYSEILFGSGRLYMASTMADKSTSGEKQYLTIAFGTTG